jgi:hypothetical protein
MFFVNIDVLGVIISGVYGCVTNNKGSWIG